MKFKIIYLALALVLVFSMAAVLLPTTEASEAQSVYKIGALFTTSGPFMNAGVPEKNTVEMMVGQINNAGGINGHPLEVIIYDDELDTQKCATLADKLIEQDEVLAIIGPSFSGTSLGIIDTITTAQIPLISLSATAGIVEPIGERYWAFKTAASEEQYITEMYTHLKNEGISKIALITEIDFGTESRNRLIADAPGYGLTIVDDQTFKTGDPNVQSQLVHIGGTDAEVVICSAINVNEAVIVAQNMQTLQMNTPWYCLGATLNPYFIDTAGGAANGVIFPGYKLWVADDLPANDPQKAVLTQYKVNYETLYGESPHYIAFGGYAYDALSMVVMALEQMDEGLNLVGARTAIRNSIEQIMNFAGTSGVFTMSPTDHLGMQPGSLAMIQIVNGERTLYQTIPEHTWTFDTAGFFPKHLTDSYYGQVVLDDLVDVPDEVQGVYYSDLGTWKFWAPGAPGCTLATLGGGHTYDYLVAVTGLCEWDVPLQ